MKLTSLAEKIKFALAFLVFSYSALFAEINFLLGNPTYIEDRYAAFDPCLWYKMFLFDIFCLGCFRGQGWLAQPLSIFGVFGLLSLGLRIIWGFRKRAQGRGIDETHIETACESQRASGK